MIKPKTRLPFRHAGALALAAALVAGCGAVPLEPKQNLAKSVAEAGETHVAVLAVQPWRDIARDLSPDFELTPAKAFEQSIPRLSAYEEKLLDGFAASLNVGLPRSSVTQTRTTDLATGEQTGQRIEESGPGETPGQGSVPDAIPADRSLDKLRGLNDATFEGVLDDDDPFLRYQAAASLFQYVKVVQGLVANTPEFEGYKPYLVTLQITSFPYARRQPYDVYLDLSFYPKVDGGAVAASRVGKDKRAISKYLTPIVVPVLITDNLQAQSTSRAAELIRQFGLAADALSGGIAASLGISAENRRSAASFGTEYTSSFTIGRSAENGLTAVLGAAINPQSDFAMIRRTHNVSLLLFVPDETADAKHQFGPVEHDGAVLRRVQMLATTELRRADEPGASLSLRGDTEPFENMLRSMVDRGLTEPESGWPQSPKAEDDLIVALYPHVPESNYPEFLKTLKAFAPEYLYPEALYHVMIDAYGRSANFRTTTITLPKLDGPPKDRRALSAPKQTVGVFDSQKTGIMQAVITGVDGDVPKDTTATLTLRTKKGLSVPVVSSRVAKAGALMTIEFPSAAVRGVADVKPGSAKLELNIPGCGAKTAQKCFAFGAVYQVGPKPEAAKPAAKPAVKPAAKPAEKPKEGDAKPKDGEAKSGADGQAGDKPAAGAAKSN